MFVWLVSASSFNEFQLQLSCSHELRLQYVGLKGNGEKSEESKVDFRKLSYQHGKAEMKTPLLALAFALGIGLIGPVAVDAVSGKLHHVKNQVCIGCYGIDYNTA